MSASSEEEIYKRRKKQTEIKEDLENLFEDANDESSEIEYKFNEEHIFQEVFGTGHEYDYIYKTDKVSASVDTPQKNPLVAENAPKYFYYEDDIYAFLLEKSTINEIEKKSVQLLLQGYSVFYIFFHCKLCFDFKKLRKIKKRISEYVKLKKFAKEGTNIGHFEDIAEYTKVKQYYERFSDEHIIFSDLFSSKYMLSVEQLYDNVVNNDEIYICTNSNISSYNKLLQMPFDDFIHRVSRLFASHPLFCKIVYKYGKENVISHFVGTGDAVSVKKDVITRAIANIENYSSMVERKKQQIIKDDIKDTITKRIVDMILNGGRPIKGLECVLGLFEYKKQFFGSIVDHKGKCLEHFVLKDINMIESKIETHEPVYVVYTSTERSLRYNLSKLETKVNCDLIIIDNEMTYKLYGFDDLRNYSIHLAKRVMWPEVELCKLRHNRIKLESLFDNKSLTNEEYFEAMDLGIKIGLTFVGVDINKLAYNDYKPILPYIGVDEYFLEQVINYGEIPSLKLLKEAWFLTQKIEKDNALLLDDPINDYDNSCVFLRCYNDTLLDQFMVHPKNYGYAKVLALAAFNEESAKDSNTIIERVLQNPGQITKFNMSAIAQTGNSEMINIKNYLLIHKRKHFSGVSDKTLFFDIIGIIEKKDYSAQIKKIDRHFFIASISPSENDYIKKPVSRNNTIDVFSKGDTSAYFSNQYVTLRVEDASFSNLSYTGNTVDEKKLKKLPRFVDSIWYKNLNYHESEKYLLDNNKLCLVRQSSKGYTVCVVTVKLSLNPQIFVHLKLSESATHYEFNKDIYDDIDEFITRYVKQMLIQVKKIKQHKHFSRDKISGAANLLLMKYALYLSEEYPGRLVFAYKNGNRIIEEYIKIEDQLTQGNKKYNTVDQYIESRIN